MLDIFIVCSLKRAHSHMFIHQNFMLFWWVGPRVTELNWKITELEQNYEKVQTQNILTEASAAIQSAFCFDIGPSWRHRFFLLASRASARASWSASCDALLELQSTHFRNDPGRLRISHLEENLFGTFFGKRKFDAKQTFFCLKLGR